MKKLISTLLFISGLLAPLLAQKMVRGQIFDSQTKEPIAGATVAVPDLSNGTSTDASGSFVLQTDSKTLLLSSVGYEKTEMTVPESGEIKFGMTPSASDLQAVVVTANRDAQSRADVPMSISKIPTSLINDTKANTLSELIGKTPGVYMMRLTGEGHNMSIRQPLSTSNYFLYMEDGVPVRPMGLFNHNALIETNIMIINSIEVVKGPVSSIYGPEAVGGAINLITNRPTAVPTFKIGYQGDEFNFRRLQFGGGAMLTNKLGIYVGGFLSDQQNGWRERSDYFKNAVNVKLEYQLSDKTSLTGSYAFNDYEGQEGLSLDSTAFYSRSYEASNDFMYRNIRAVRSRLTLQHRWNDNAESFVTVFHRFNDYQMSPNHTVRWTTGSTTATSEKNKSLFNSYGVIAQHSQRVNFLDGKILFGGTFDYTPQEFTAFQIDLTAELRPDGRSVRKYLFQQDRPEIQLSNYDASIYSTGIYSQFDFELLKDLRVSAGVRYDRMAFDYNNYLDNTSGNKSYDQFSPKIGAVYHFAEGKAVYANYAIGFAPPGVTAIFRKRVNAQPGEDLFYYNLKPARFTNAEIGTWFSVLRDRLFADVTVYRLTGENELLSIRQPDNSTDFQSVGKTLHEGIELGMTFKPTRELLVRVGGALARHRFEDFQISNRPTDLVQNLDGYEMPSAPSLISNVEFIYKPQFIKGLRLGAEWQRLSTWYVNQVNTVQYEDEGFLGARGVSILNLRAGYEWKGIEIFINALNATDELYVASASRGNGVNDRINYSPSAPRTIGFGIQYNFVGKK